MGVPFSRARTIGPLGSVDLKFGGYLKDRHQQQLTCNSGASVFINIPSPLERSPFGNSGAQMLRNPGKKPRSKYCTRIGKLGIHLFLAPFFLELKNPILFVCLFVLVHGVIWVESSYSNQGIVLRKRVSWRHFEMSIWLHPLIPGQNQGWPEDREGRAQPGSWFGDAVPVTASRAHQTVHCKDMRGIWLDYADLNTSKTLLKCNY